MRRPNEFLWMLTMNSTKASRDLVSRGLPIRLYYEGPADQRRFGDGDPVEYARQHRAELLGELAGMVLRWNQIGRPSPPQSVQHRCREWAWILGGILHANGFPEFLQNQNEATQDFDQDVDQLAAVAEIVLLLHHDDVVDENHAGFTATKTGPKSTAKMGDTPGFFDGQTWT